MEKEGEACEREWAEVFWEKGIKFTNNIHARIKCYARQYTVEKKKKGGSV